MNEERDSLTGLHKWVCGLAQLEHAVAEAKQQGKTAAVIFTDIEHFSDLNCSLGHLAGDIVLRQLAEGFQRVVAGKGTVCRYWYDEFVVVLPGASAADAKEVAEEIREQVATQTINIYERDYTVTITLTVGIASYPANGQDAESLLRAAEEAAPPTKWCRRAREAGQHKKINAEA